jgi:PEP-CTERM motif
MLSLASMLGLAAVLALGAVAASATVIETAVDLVLKPDGKGKNQGLDGTGFGMLYQDDSDDTFMMLMLSEFVFDDGSSPSNVPEKFNLQDGAFTLKTSDLSVEFALGDTKKGLGIGGTYTVTVASLIAGVDGILGGEWKLSERSVPEPGSLALLGVTLLGFGLARYRRKTV